MVDIRDIRVSRFRSYYDKSPSIVRIGEWIDGVTWCNKLVDEIRAASGQSRAELKKRLPAITPSGIFTGRGAEYLVESSGIICIDIDGVDPTYAKSILRPLPYVAYASASVSGGGVFAFIPVSDPVAHKMHFKAIERDLASVGLVVDPICANISHLRFYSYDEDPVAKEAAIYRKKMEPRKETVPDPSEGDDAIKTILRKINDGRIDITATYGDWLAVGGCLASIYGEQGRGLFHQFSQYHPEYNKRRADRQYDRCLAYGGRFGIGLLLNVCKKYGVMLASASGDCPPSSFSGGGRIVPSDKKCKKGG